MNQKFDELAKKLWDFLCLHQPVKKADCIVVLGSYDVRVAHRGAELFLQGYAPVVVMSGNFGRVTSGRQDKSEAEIFGEEAVRSGVPRGKILIEDKSTNTGENLLFSLKLLRAKQVEASSVILVTKSYMERRAWATFKKIFPERQVSVTSPQIAYEDGPYKDVTKNEMINIMVGDMQRVKTYPAKGFQVPQAIPLDVEDAYEQLVALGYVSHLI